MHQLKHVIQGMDKKKNRVMCFTETARFSHQEVQRANAAAIRNFLKGVEHVKTCKDMMWSQFQKVDEEKSSCLLELSSDSSEYDTVQNGS